MFKKVIFLTGLLLCFGLLHGQKYPEHDFIPPLDIPLKLSGTFGELRSNHFHSGIDLKTGEMEGLKVYAIAGGTISRIKIQPGGYGKALYITHPNGFVSVYAHLSKYNSVIDDYVKQLQYDKKSYEIDIYPAGDLFPVSQGEIIAYSGNSGSSGGPHLHFEIRSETSQKPINPLQFNFAVTDKNTPIINLLKVYPVGKMSTVEKSGSAKEFFTKLNGPSYSLAGNDTIAVTGMVYFGINTYDPFNGGMNKNGVYAVRLFADDELIYAHELRSFSFDETRYINSFIDYKEYKDNSRRVQRSFIDPSNKLGIYTHKNSNGLSVPSGSTIRIRYEVTDIAGNAAELVFWVKGGTLVPDAVEIGSRRDSEIFSYHRSNTFKTSEVELLIPGGALYDTLSFVYAQLPAPPGALSAVHQLHYDFVPIHSWCNLAIKSDGAETGLRDKAIVVKMEEKNELSPCGGEYKDGFVHTRIREFGNYCIMIDTVPPKIIPVNIKNNKSLLAQNTIQMKITDKLSGIGTYNGYLNGDWILMEYDEKNDLLTYHFDHILKDGDNTFELIVTDERKNRSSYQAVLTY